MEIYSFCLINSFGLVECLLANFFKGYCVEFAIRILWDLRFYAWLKLFQLWVGLFTLRHYAPFHSRYTEFQILTGKLFQLADEEGSRFLLFLIPFSQKYLVFKTASRSPSVAGDTTSSLVKKTLSGKYTIL